MQNHEETVGDMKQTSLRDVHLGESKTLQRVFTQEEVKQCAALTGDSNPLYLDETFAAATRYRRTIVQALLTEGLITALINQYIPGPGALLLEKELVFPFPVFVGETITARVEVIDIDHERHWLTQKVICHNPHGQEVIRGQIVLHVQNGQDVTP